jgi:hypothetical protein
VQVRSGELEQQCKAHRRTIRELRAILSDQREDAQSALDMVSKRPRNFFSGPMLPKPLNPSSTLPRPATASAEYKRDESRFGDADGRRRTGLRDGLENGKGHERNVLRDGLENEKGHEGNVLRDGLESGNGQGRLGLGDGSEHRNGQERDRLRNGLETSPSTTGGSSVFGEKTRRRHHHHRSRRRREKGMGQKDGYVSVPLETGNIHELLVDEHRLRVDNQVSAAEQRSGVDNHRLGVDTNRLGAVGHGSRGGTWSAPRRSIPEGLGGEHIPGVNTGREDGMGQRNAFASQSRTAVPGLQRGPASSKVEGRLKPDGIVDGRPELRDGVINRNGEVEDLGLGPSGADHTRGVLDDLLLTETESELGIGLSSGRVTNLGDRIGYAPANRPPPAGQWPSRGLEEMAAAFSQPTLVRAGDSNGRDQNEGFARQEAPELAGASGQKQDAVSQYEVWKTSAAAAGSEELQKGMAVLDQEIAHLQSSLQAASWRLQM